LSDVPKPVPEAKEVLLRIARIGVCGSDIHVFHGTHPYTSYPVVQGHEFSAVIDGLGPEVTGLVPGMKVTAMPQIVCGQCKPCLRGDYHICDHLKVQGFTPGTRLFHSSHPTPFRNGTHSPFSWRAHRPSARGAQHRK